MNDKLVKRLTKRIGTKRSAEIMIKVFYEVEIGEHDNEFRATLTLDEEKLMDEYASAYVTLLLRYVADKLSALRPMYLTGV